MKRTFGHLFGFRHQLCRFHPFAHEKRKQKNKTRCEILISSTNYYLFSIQITNESADVEIHILYEASVHML